MNSVLSSITAFLFLLQVLFGLGGIKDKGGFDNNGWMKNINDNKLISEISIPGSHNSGALYEPVYSVAKCQNYTINDQLNMGVRMLDIRAKVSLGKLKIVHGVVMQGSTFEKTAECCYKFLNDNPSETILLSLRNEDGDTNKTASFVRLLKKEIESNKNLWYTENRLPKIGEVRGKIILINRFDRESTLGLNAAHDCKNNDTFTIYNNGYFINIQDVYRPSSIEQKKDFALSFFKNNYLPAVTTPTLCLNFISCSSDSGSIPQYSYQMNGFFIEFSKTNPPFYGCVLFDFVTEELCDIIINANK
ncbi:MAG: phosphatidylinositol-specific phospholipase C [Oscillospiraceae bacterium]|nr:phosphatidylinositol-specific phospholipase C [Oscillospiraceae bacterium]